MKDFDYSEISEKIKNLDDTDLLLLCTVAESFPIKSEEIQFRFNKKFQRKFNHTVERNTTKHRLRYLQLMKLLLLTDGKGFEPTFPVDILLSLGLISGGDNDEEEYSHGNDKNDNDKNDNDKSDDDIDKHEEVTDKLQALLETDEKNDKYGCKYLTGKKKRL